MAWARVNFEMLDRFGPGDGGGMGLHCVSEE